MPCHSFGSTSDKLTETMLERIKGVLCTLFNIHVNIGDDWITPIGVDNYLFLSARNVRPLYIFSVNPCFSTTSSDVSQSFKVENIIVHPDYIPDHASNQHDLAVIKIREDEEIENAKGNVYWMVKVYCTSKRTKIFWML